MMIQRPRGTRDFGPDEMEKRRYLEGMMRKEAATFGFREVATPIFEHTELFTTRSGPNIMDEMYVFQDKSGREISLRPELTAPVIRFFVNELTDQPRPLKMFYFGQCFRYERPQSGRYREFFQFGCELIGNPGPESDAEVIALAASIMRRIGLKEYNIRIGHIGVLRGLLSEAGVDQNKAASILQKLDKKEYEEARARMTEAGLSTEKIERIIEVTSTVGGTEVLDKIAGDARSYLEAMVRISGIMVFPMSKWIWVLYEVLITILEWSLRWMPRCLALKNRYVVADHIPLLNYSAGKRHSRLALG